MTLVDTGAAFVLLLVLFGPLERLFPAQRQPLLRPGLAADVCFFVGQYLLWGAPVVAILVALKHGIDALPLHAMRAGFATLPFLAQVVLALLLSDLCTYWAHRASHASRFLWRFHRVHHTAEQLDWLAAHREHPVDNLYTRLVENLPLLLLGFPLGAIAGFATFRGLWAILIHSNVAFDPGPLRRVLGAPRLHHWHHDRSGRAVNFANLSPLMDLLFGTYRDPGHWPREYGIADDGPRGFFAQMLAPLPEPRRDA